jgi:hypothetical protein
MKQKILEIIQTKPKHYSKIIKNVPELCQWVTDNTLINSEKFAEMIYSAIYQTTNICVNGNTQKFLDINRGFAGCGLANICKCVHEQVSKSVKDYKKTITNEQQTEINNKRRQTNLEKYGVSCVAQTEENKQKFRDWYNNPENVKESLERIKKTNIEKYGVENCKSLPEVEQKIIATCLAKYGVTNVAQIPSTKMKLKARIAEYKLNKHLIKKGYDRFSLYILNTYNFSVLTPKDEYLGYDAHQSLKFSCNACNTLIEKVFSYGPGLRCNHCNPVIPNFVSSEEQQVYDFITNELGILGKQGDKTLINPYELDMVFDQHKIAIEYCGLYWHSEASSHKDKNYHANKMRLTNEKGYRLITIFSDEWKYKQPIVKSKLKNIFQQTARKHHARKLSVKLVPYQESQQFLNLHHLQGSSVAKINLGLYTNLDELVALMTFSNGRAALNSKTLTTEYELVRFVTNGDSVIGGASKLLTNFITMYSPSKIISYADLRWSEGAVYEKIGFIKQPKPTIGYWYTANYEKREHRFNFTKTRLVKEGADGLKTEWEIMQGLGYDRIWDCGHLKYVLDLMPV